MDLAPGYLAILGAAFALGILHALEPGHGKAIMGAWIVAARGGVRHAVLLGGVVALTHTAVVLLLAAGALYFSGRFQQGDISYWFGIISSLLVLAVGIGMILRTFGSHRHGGEEGHGHAHGTTMPEGRDRLGFWSLVAVGTSGGLVPCPAALAALLAALNMGQPLKGFGVVVALSLGIAVALIAIGILFVQARDWIGARYGAGGWLAGLPRVSAVVISLMGCAMLVAAVLARGSAAHGVAPAAGAAPVQGGAMQVPVGPGGRGGATALYQEGERHRLLGERQAALEDFTRAIEQDPGLVEAVMCRAAVRQMPGDAKPALADIGTVIEARPGSVFAYKVRSNIYTALRKYDLALADIEKALGLRAGFSCGFHDRGTIRARLGQDREAMADFEMAILSTPNASCGYEARAGYLLSRGQAERAGEDIERAIAAVPGSPDGYLLRAALREDARNARGAMEDAEAVIRLAPGSAAGYALRARLNFLGGRRSGALEDIEKAVRLAPGDAGLLVSRAIIRAAMGQGKTARADLEAAAAVDPGLAGEYLEEGKRAMANGRDVPAFWRLKGHVLLEGRRTGSGEVASNVAALEKKFGVAAAGADPVTGQ